ncbi:glycoside hydrolase family 92 protein [Terrilactibacillus sp. S3-3]|nr:glycoside hydrolase family 92 protein [Terrilactibacillus sp. S3-3]
MFVINAPNVSNKNKYIQSVTLNGQNYSNTTVSHNILAQGATLTFDMGPQPSLWGSSTSDLPQAITPASTNGSSLYPKALVDLTNTAGSKQGVVTGSENRSYGALFDHNSDTATLFRSHYPSIPVTFKKGKQRVTMYTLTSSANGGGTSDPKGWTLSGSNDGKKWETWTSAAASRSNGGPSHGPSLSPAPAIIAITNWTLPKITENQCRHWPNSNCLATRISARVSLLFKIA